MKNELYWSFNLPLQMWPIHENDDESSPVTDYQLLNYMPRKEACTTLNLSEILEEQTHEEFCEAAAQHLEHLAQKFRKMGKKELDHIYYPDEGMDKSTLP